MATVTLQDYTAEIVRGGFPGLRAASGRAQRAELDGYLARIVDRDIADSGRAVRNPVALTSWLRAYAAATATNASYEVIRDAATPGESDKVAKSTTGPYRDTLTNLWILEPVPGWTSTRNHLSRLTVAPKHHLADPCLAARRTTTGWSPSK